VGEEEQWKGGRTKEKREACKEKEGEEGREGGRRERREGGGRETGTTPTIQLRQINSVFCPKHGIICKINSASDGISDGETRDVRSFGHQSLKP
jgi:hypothetical protein